MKSWVCPVCGYVHEGEELLAACPICHIDGSRFISSTV
jgi:rubrerythrin